MQIISIDLPWNEKVKGRRILAIAELQGHVSIMPAGDDSELIELVSQSAKQKSFVLLDIPIDGCDGLNGRHFRPIDKALAQQGIWTLPASRAGGRGEELKEILESKGYRVYEIYPYAIYKFLAYLWDKNSIPRPSLDKFDTLLDENFRVYQPPKYKRAKKKEERLNDMEYLYSLLMDGRFDLKFLKSLRRPGISHSLSDLDTLCDEYDAYLGIIAGIYLAKNSRYACIAGDPDSGSILLLADRWLAGQLGER